jgi:hypothetical protein
MQALAVIPRHRPQSPLSVTCRVSDCLLPRPSLSLTSAGAAATLKLKADKAAARVASSTPNDWPGRSKSPQQRLTAPTNADQAPETHGQICESSLS